MTSLDKALALSGLGTIFLGIAALIVTFYTGSLWSWFESIVVLIGIGVLFIVTGRVLLPTDAVADTS